jgi:hypothetical protein
MGYSSKEQNDPFSFVCDIYTEGSANLKSPPHIFSNPVIKVKGAQTP